MTRRRSNHEPLLTDKVIDTKADAWNAASQAAARTDSVRVLEALVAEYGVDAAITALDKQGFMGAAYRYLLAPLYEKARRRRGAFDD